MPIMFTCLVSTVKFNRERVPDPLSYDLYNRDQYLN